MIAAMKKVLSPISDAKIIPHDFAKPCTEVSKLPASVHMRNSDGTRIRNTGTVK